MLDQQLMQLPLVLEALTHKSFWMENKGLVSGFNERLEYLGDAVLGMVVSRLLFDEYPDKDEGYLSKLRAELVNEKTLSKWSQELQLDQALRLGKGEELSGGRQKSRLLASVFEALVGAVYKSKGLDFVSEWLEPIVRRQLELNRDAYKNLTNEFTDYKTQLQEVLQAKAMSLPQYRLVEEKGPSHQKEFLVELSLAGSIFSSWGKTKKNAEQEVAKMCLSYLNLNKNVLD